MKRKSSKKLSEFIEPYMLITPLLILLAVFILYPVIANIVMSFFKWNGIKKPVFIGIENYKKMFKVAKYSFITEIEDNHQIPTICIYGGTDDTVGVTQYAYLKQKVGDKRHLDFIYSRYEGHALIAPKTPDGVAKLWDASSLFMNYFKKYFGY